MSARTIQIGRYGPTPLGRGRELRIGGRSFLEVKDGPFATLYERLPDGSLRRIGEFRRSWEAHRRAIEEASR